MGYLTGIKYRLTSDGTEYSYLVTHNWRGDIIGIYSGSGVLTAKYEYDTWGKVKSVKDGNGNRITDQNNVGNLNPFRYRGYYYDTESQLYYLMSRYYDPVTHRFINADGYFQAGNAILDANMNAYCGNNPVNRLDSSGTCWLPIYSTCGAQMGSYWMTMGNVPGVWYCCKKCGKNDPNYNPPPNPKPPAPQPEPVPAPSDKKYFDTIDEAAINFVLKYNAISISSCREYTAPFNQVEIDGKIMYMIGKLDIGDVRIDANGNVEIYSAQYKWDSKICRTAGLSPAVLLYLLYKLRFYLS